MKNKYIIALLLILVLLTACSGKNPSNPREGGNSGETVTMDKNSPVEDAPHDNIKKDKEYTPYFDNVGKDGASTPTPNEDLVNLPKLEEKPIPGELRGAYNIDLYRNLDQLSPRDFLQLPNQIYEIFKSIGVRKDTRIADIGCGPGKHSFALSELAGEKGKVYAIDADPNAIAFLKRQIKKLEILEKKHYDNLEVILSRVDNVGLKENSIDTAFLSQLHNYSFPPPGIGRSADEVNRLFTESIYRALKPGGKLAIIEFYKKHNKGAINDQKQVVKMIESYAPFKLEFVTDNIEREGKSYLLVFKKIEKSESPDK